MTADNKLSAIGQLTVGRDFLLKTCMSRKVLVLGSIASVLLLLIYWSFSLKYIYMMYEPRPTFTYSNNGDGRWHNVRMADDQLDMSTNATLFLSRCSTGDFTGDFWRLDKDKTTFDYDVKNHNVLKNTNPVFRRVNSSYGYSCPAIPTCSNVTLPKTALLTFPRSGNTWSRHFLEQLTGLPTGSVYDAQVLKSRFLCEGQTDGVVVIKTHEPSLFSPVPEGFSHEKSYDKILLILRNPFKSFISFYQFEMNRFRMTDNRQFDVKDKAWDNFIKKSTSHWKEFVIYAMENSLPKAVFFYEDLTQNLFKNLLRISLFLNSEKITDFSFCCALINQEGSFHKKHSKNEYLSDFYTLKQRNIVNEGIDQVSQSLRKQHPSIADYLSSYKIEKRGGQ